MGHSETESGRRKEKDEVGRGAADGGVVPGAAAGSCPPLSSNETAKAAG